MIKALGETGDGTPLVILGVTPENLALLAARKPIRVDLRELGLPPMVIAIVCGATDEAIVAEMRAHRVIHPDATHHDKRTGRTYREASN